MCAEPREIHATRPGAVGTARIEAQRIAPPALDEPRRQIRQRHLLHRARPFDWSRDVTRTRSRVPAHAIHVDGVSRVVCADEQVDRIAAVHAGLRRVAFDLA